MEEKSPIQHSTESPTVEDYESLLKADRKHQFAQKSVIGTFRNPQRLSWIEWVFLVVATLSLLGVFALNIERFVTFERDFYNLTEADNSSVPFQCPRWFCTTDFIFSVLLLINLMFCFFYCLDGLFRERKFELLAFVGATVVIIIYIVGNYIFDVERQRDISALKKIRLSFVCIFGPINIVLAIVGWWKMGFFVLNVIGANKKLSDAYHLKSFFTTLQYFHVEIMANIVTLSFALNGTLISEAEKIITMLIFPYLLIVVFLGSMTVHWEKLLGVFLWYILSIPCVAFYLYKLVQVSIHWSDYTLEYMLVDKDGEVFFNSIKFIGITLIVAVILGLMAIAVLAGSLAFVTRNFHLGLKEKVDPPFTRCIHALTSMTQK